MFELAVELGDFYLSLGNLVMYVIGLMYVLKNTVTAAKAVRYFAKGV